MSIEPLQATDDWSSPLPPDQCIADVGTDVAARHSIAGEGPGWVELRGGSRLAFRLVGVFVPYGRNRVPWRATVHALPTGSGSSVSVKMSSDQGAYLLPPIPSAVGAWSAQFELLDESLRRATQASSPRPLDRPLTLTGGGAQRYAAESSRSRSQRLGRLALTWLIAFLVATAVFSLADSSRYSGAAVLAHAAVTGLVAACVITLLSSVVRRP